MRNSIDAEKGTARVSFEESSDKKHTWKLEPRSSHWIESCKYFLVSLSRIYYLSQWEVRWVQKEDKKGKKSKRRKGTQGEIKLLKGHHLQHKNMFQQDNKFLHLQLVTFRIGLLSEFSHLQSISHKTITMTLKNDLILRFKKLYKFNSTVFIEKNWLNFIKSSYLMTCLWERDVDLLYFDEFSISTRKLQFQGRSK